VLPFLYVFRALADPDSSIRGATLPFLLSPSLPSPSLSLPPYSSLPLEVGLLNTARGLSSTVSTPSGVWGRAPAEIEFGAF